MTVASVSRRPLIASSADLESSADVGSSTKITGDFCNRARIMTTRNIALIHSTMPSVIQLNNPLFGIHSYVSPSYGFGT